MAKSTMAVNSANIVTVIDGTANAAADVNTSITEIVTKFNAMLETSAGHNHDGTNSPLVAGTDWTPEDLLIGSWIGMFGGGRY